MQLLCLLNYQNLEFIETILEVKLVSNSFNFDFCPLIRLFLAQNKQFYGVKRKRNGIFAPKKEIVGGMHLNL